MRKSPVQHTVNCRSSHYQVRSYVRGRGQPIGRSYSTRTVLPRMKEGIICDETGEFKREHCGECSDKESFHTSHEARSYTLNLQYTNGEKETVKVIGHSPEEALHLGLMKSKRPSERPTKVVVKNVIGQIVGGLLAHGIGGLKALGRTYKATRRKSILQERAKKGDVAAIQELRRLKIQEDIEKGQREALKEEKLI